MDLALTGSSILRFIASMTKRLHLNSPEPPYPDRSGKTVPWPITALIGACAIWYGFGEPNMDDMRFTKIAQSIITQCRQEVSQTRDLVSMHVPL